MVSEVLSALLSTCLSETASSMVALLVCSWHSAYGKSHHASHQQDSENLPPSGDQRFEERREYTARNVFNSNCRCSFILAVTISTKIFLPSSNVQCCRTFNPQATFSQSNATSQSTTFLQSADPALQALPKWLPISLSHPHSSDLPVATWTKPLVSQPAGTSSFLKQFW